MESIQRAGGLRSVRARPNLIYSLRFTCELYLILKVSQRLLSIYHVS